MIDLSLYLVTDDAMCGARGVPGTVVEAVRGGATIVQVRAKHAGVQEVCDSVAAIREALADAGLPAVPIIVNDDVEAASASGAEGLHLGQSDGDPVAARERLGPNAVIGLSVSTRAQVTAALALPDGTIDHLGVGPAWSTDTKADAAKPLGPSGTAALVKAAGGMPCVAIGGINLDRVGPLRGIGLAGICVVSAICAAADPQQAAAALRGAWG